jgi:hypothetical protein
MALLCALLLTGIILPPRPPYTQINTQFKSVVPVETVRWIEIARSPTDSTAINPDSIIIKGEFTSVMVRTITEDSDQYVVHQWVYFRKWAALVNVVVVNSRTGKIVGKETSFDNPEWATYPLDSPAGFVKEAIDAWVALQKK